MAPFFVSVHAASAAPERSNICHASRAMRISGLNAYQNRCNLHKKPGCYSRALSPERYSGQANKGVRSKIDHGRHPFGQRKVNHGRGDGQILQPDTGAVKQRQFAL
jgi:hypothetical protein